jgi:hypothetical protein
MDRTVLTNAQWAKIEPCCLILQFHFMRVFSDARLLHWPDVVGARMTMAE